MVESLTVIFGQENPSVEPVVFPCEDEIVELLQEDEPMEAEVDPPSTSSPDTESDTAPIQYSFNQPLAVVWEEGRSLQWYVGFYLDVSDDETFRVDHLVRSATGSQLWERPPESDDIQDTTYRQIVPVAVAGHWDFSKRKPTYIVENSEEIQQTFRQISK